MIQVIKHGNKKRVCCSNCDCLFTYEHEDVNSVQLKYNEYDTYVICPDCGEEIKCVWLSN